MSPPQCFALFAAKNRWALMEAAGGNLFTSYFCFLFRYIKYNNRYPSSQLYFVLVPELLRSGSLTKSMSCEVIKPGHAMQKCPTFKERHLAVSKLSIKVFLTVLLAG